MIRKITLVIILFGLILGGYYFHARYAPLSALAVLLIGLILWGLTRKKADPHKRVSLFEVFLNLWW